PDNPKKGTTASVGPAVDWWMRAGRSRLSAKSSGQYLYFKEYENERAWNTTNEGRWEIPLGRITPFLTGTYTNTRDRPGYEIDSRDRMLTKGFGAGADIALSAKTLVTIGAHRSRTAFDQQDTFLGTTLAHALDRQTVTAEME